MNSQLSKNVEAMAESIQWFGQSAVKIQYSCKTIYIDPYSLKVEDKADAIFITHSHFDHYSEEDIKRIASPDTVIFCPAELTGKAKLLKLAKVYEVAPGYESEWKGIPIKAVPAYNLIKKDKHPRSSNWVGYIITLGHVKIYHTGDTERIPEMKENKCDIILLPLGQTYTMNTIEEAVDVVIDTEASVAIPIHFGLYEGKTEDAELFKRLLEGRVEVLIPEKV